MDFQLTEEQQMLKQTVREFAEKELKPKAAYWDEHEEPPLENLKKLADLGFLGITIPEEYGGAGGDYIDFLVVSEEIARCCANTAMLSSNADFSVTRALLYYGTEAQKQEYIPRMVKGELLTAWSMSEPNAGSDLGNIQSVAHKDGNGYRINGSKTFCTCGQLADLFFVFVRFGDTPGTKGIGGVLIERDTPGFSTSKHISCMGLRGTGMSQVFLEDVWVPEENVLVPAGGLRQLMEIVDIDRVISNPNISLGVAQGALDEAIRYAKERVQFKQPIAQFQGIQWMLADMAMKLDAARLLVYRAASNAAKGVSSMYEASVAKTMANEAAIEVTNQAIQIFGGYGYTKEYPVERMSRDVRGMAIGFGTTQIQRNMIARALLK